MRFKISLVCILILAVAVTGCGPKSASVKHSEKAEKRVASGHAPAGGGDASGRLPAKHKASSDQPSTGLPFNVPQAPSALDQALNPLAALNPGGTAPQAVPGAPGVAKALSATPAMAPPSMTKPKPEQLLAVLQMRYRSAKTFRTSGVSTGIMKADGKTMSKTTDPKSAFLFKRPNKIAISGSDEQLITNGKTLVRYSPETKRFAKSALDKDTERQLMQHLVGSQMGVRSLGLLLGVDYLSATSSMKLLNDAKIGGRDTYVLVLNLKQGVGCPKGMKASQTLWIGKKDLAIYKNLLVAKGKPEAPKGFKGKMPKSVETTICLTATKCEFDSNIADSKFTFNPPAGVKPAEDPAKNYLQDKAAPDFAFTWTDGSQKKLSDFRGQIVILDCWALPMCEKHLPVLQKLYEKHKDSVQLISVCFNEDKEKVGKYLAEKGLNFPVVYADRSNAKIFEDKYHLQVLPTIFILDKSGIVKDRMLGLPEEKDIDAKLDKVKQ